MHSLFLLEGFNSGLKQCIELALGDLYDLEENRCIMRDPERTVLCHHNIC